jgi:hypothetical protein
MAECCVCGKPMSAATKRKRYCSRACQQESYRHRKATPTQTPCDDTRGLLHGSTGLRPYAYPERVLDPRIGSEGDLAQLEYLNDLDRRRHYKDQDVAKAKQAAEREMEEGRKARAREGEVA